MKDQSKYLFLSCAYCSFLVLSASFLVVFGIDVAASGIWAMNFKVQFANRSTILLMVSRHEMSSFKSGVLNRELILATEEVNLLKYKLNQASISVLENLKTHR